MDQLYRRSESILRRVSLDSVRPLYDDIDWEVNMVALLGARGVGKTTLLLQRLRQLDLPSREGLYVDLGDIYFQENRILDFITTFVEQGGRYLFLDEVHRYGYGTWAQELKQAYDIYHGEIKIAFTGSSAIQILQQKADLSRRARLFHIGGLSFREYLLLAHDIRLPRLAWEEILNDHRKLSNTLLSEPNFHPLPYLQEYWLDGYYPFFLSDPGGYQDRLSVVLQLVLESDIPAILDQGRVDYQKISRLLFAIASSLPFKPNIEKLGSRLGMARETILKYLELLERADIITTLRREEKGVASLGKPDKIYLNNNNLLHTLAPNQIQIGTLRETFFLAQLHTLTRRPAIPRPEVRLPKRGDFAFLNQAQRYLFKVGGPNKGIGQIGLKENHYVVADVESSVTAHVIPLWLFGLLN